MVLCKVLVVGNAKCGKTSIIKRFASPEESFVDEYHTTVGADFVRRDIKLATPDLLAKVDNGTIPPSAMQIRMQLWDIAGQDRFAKLTRAYFRKAKAAAIVCDLTREGTLDAVRQWKTELDAFTVEQRQERGDEDDNGGLGGDKSSENAENKSSGSGKKNEKAASGGGGGGGGGALPVVLFANKCDLLDHTQASSSEAFLLGARMEALCRELGIAAWFVTSAKDGSNVDAGFRHLASLVAGNIEHKPATPTGASGGISTPAVDMLDRVAADGKKQQRRLTASPRAFPDQKHIENPVRSPKAADAAATATIAAEEFDNPNIAFIQTRQKLPLAACAGGSNQSASPPCTSPSSPLLDLVNDDSDEEDTNSRYSDQQAGVCANEKGGDNRLLQVWDIDDF